MQPSEEIIKINMYIKKEDWSGLPFPPPGDLPDPGNEPVSLKSPAVSGRFFSISATWEVQIQVGEHQRARWRRLHLTRQTVPCGHDLPSWGGDTGDTQLGAGIHIQTWRPPECERYTGLTCSAEVSKDFSVTQRKIENAGFHWVFFNLLYVGHS